MSSYNWIANPSYNDLNPEVGNLAILHFDDQFQYSVKSLIIDVSEDKITADVEAVFDRNDKMWVKDHELNGKQLILNKKYIQEVVKKGE